VARDQLGRFAAGDDFFVKVMQHVDAATLSKASPKADPRLGELRKAGFTPEGIDQVREFGSARGLTDPIEAMHAYEAQHPVPTMVVTPRSRFQGLNVARPARVPDMAELLANSNDDRWLDNAIGETLKEMRSQPDPNPVLSLLTVGFS
jgi:hypothetical protein